MAVVVFPTPPFWLATAITRPIFPAFWCLGSEMERSSPPRTSQGAPPSPELSRGATFHGEQCPDGGSGAAEKGDDSVEGAGNRKRFAQPESGPGELPRDRLGPGRPEQDRPARLEKGGLAEQE